MNDDVSLLKRQKNFFQNLAKVFAHKSSKTDLKKSLQEARENNVIDAEEAAMIAGVLSVSEQRVRDIMLPKPQMVMLQSEMSFEETVKVVLASGHSRFPIEHDEDIIGILLAKDLLGYINQPPEAFKLESIMRPVRLIPESKPLDILLREFRHQRLHMVIVTNEYGDVSGLATIEDVLEEIVGEIDDEYDSKENEDIRKITDDSYHVSALTKVEDFNEAFATQLDEEASDTIGGFVLSHFGYVPKKGEKVNFANLTFTVKNADDRRIRDLLVER